MDDGETDGNEVMDEDKDDDDEPPAVVLKPLKGRGSRGGRAPRGRGTRGTRLARGAPNMSDEWALASKTIDTSLSTTMNQSRSRPSKVFINC